MPPRRPQRDPRAQSNLESNVTNHLVRAFVLVACVATASTAALAEETDIVGSWQVNITTGQAQGRSAPLVLRREGANVVGVITTPQGDQHVDATVAGKAVTMWFSVRTQNGLTNVTMKGTVDGNAMSGTIDFGSGQGEWTAKRSAQAFRGTNLRAG